MRRTTHRSALLFALIAMQATVSAFGQQILRQGIEFRINSYTFDHQRNPSVAADSDGDFVVVWEGEGGPKASIYGRRYTSTGTPLGTEFQVNTFTDDIQYDADVASAADGDFVVVWKAQTLANVLARRYSSAGVAIGLEFKVVLEDGTGHHPSVDTDADGGFVIAWVDYLSDGDGGAVMASRFSSDGVALGIAFVVNQYTLNTQRYPEVALDSDGDFVMVWGSEGGQDGDDSGVFARRFSSSGVPQGTEFQVNTYTPSYQSFPAVSMGPTGDFVIAWNSNDQDGEGYGIFARRFSNTGCPLTAEFQVATYTYNYQRYPSVAVNDDGAFVVSWTSQFQDGSMYGIFARRFPSTGTAPAIDFQVNTYTAGPQRVSAAASSAGARFVVVWQSQQDGSSYGVFGQRLSTPATLDVDGNGIVEPLTDLLLGLRYSFGFSGATLINGAIGPGCTRCDAPSIEAYLATLVN